MAITADRKGSRDADRDDAADASRFFSRIGYLVLAVGAPVGVVLHPLGLYVMFSIGVGLVLIAAALDAEPGFFGRFMRPFCVPAFLALLAGLAWAALSVLWTPYPVAAGQHLLKTRRLACRNDVGGGCAAREREPRPTSISFPIGVVAGMAAIAARALAETLSGAPDDGRLAAGAVAIAVLLFPAIGGTRGSRAQRTCAAAFDRRAVLRLYRQLRAAHDRDVRRLSGAVVLDLGPDTDGARIELGRGRAYPVVAAHPGSRSDRLSLDLPRSAHVAAGALSIVSVAADVFTHDKLRLITGHGFATVAHGVQDSILPAQTPRALAFTVWYELGIVGAVLAAAAAWLAFRSLPRAPARLAPYMAAAFSAVVALAFLNVDFAEMTTLTLIAVAVISTDVAARSQYRTTRPSAAKLANL